MMHITSLMVMRGYFYIVDIICDVDDFISLLVVDLLIADSEIIWISFFPYELIIYCEHVDY